MGGYKDLSLHRGHTVSLKLKKTQTCGATGQGIIRQENDTLQNTVNVKSWVLRQVNAVIKQGVAV